MSVILIRHGRTDWNKNNITQGRVDVPLNETGILQAKEAKRKMDETRIDICFVSPMKRARMTADIVLEGRDVPLFVENRLIEMAYGDFEGVSRGKKKVLAQRRKLASRYPGGKSYPDVGQRVYSFLDEIKAKRGEKNILLVGRGGIARLIRTYFRDDIENDAFIDGILQNATPVKFEFPNRDIPLFRNLD